MIDLFAKLVGFLTQFGAAVAAFFWARNSADARTLKSTVEKQNAMLDAARDGPRDQSDAVKRLRDGGF
ncbi:MAG TPA: hypothetical protein VF449_07300 [Parvibaculum sp.]